MVVAESPVLNGGGRVGVTEERSECAITPESWWRRNRLSVIQWHHLPEIGYPIASLAAGAFLRVSLLSGRKKISDHGFLMHLHQVEFHW